MAYEFKVSVVEQEPVKGSVYCKVELNDGSVTFGSQMYFVCNLEKRIYQYFGWMKMDQGFSNELKKLGYTF